MDLAEAETALLISQRGTCTCPVCQDRHGQPIVGGEVPPYHDGCDCVAVPRGEETSETPENTSAGTQTAEGETRTGEEDEHGVLSGDWQEARTGPMTRDQFKQQLRELFTQVARRGHQALGHKEGEQEE